MQRLSPSAEPRNQGSPDSRLRAGSSCPSAWRVRGRAAGVMPPGPALGHLLVNSSERLSRVVCRGARAQLVSEKPGRDPQAGLASGLM